MQSNSSAIKNHLIADLHCHTRKSFDGFTTEKELLNVCITKKIDIIAITEHDLVNKIDKKTFKKNNIHIIDACEYTCSKGSHIIGLFVNNSIEKLSPHEIINSIKKDGGLVIIPHPFKPGSGVCSIYKNYKDILKKADLIELYNGGYIGNDFEKEKIRKFANEFDLGLIASSDSHKYNQIGYYVTGFRYKKDESLKEIITNKKTSLFIDTNQASPPRKTLRIQKNSIYQKLITFIPSFIKRKIKLTANSFNRLIIKESLYHKIG